MNNDEFVNMFGNTTPDDDMEYYHTPDNWSNVTDNLSDSVGIPEEALLYYEEPVNVCIMQALKSYYVHQQELDSNIQQEAAFEDNVQRFPGIRNYADVQYKPVEWLWPSFIPFGLLTIFAGEQGVGKSTLLAYITAVTTQFGFNVLHQNAEDSPESTTILRLTQAQAVVNRIYFIDDDENPLKFGDARWADAIQKTQAKLVIIDPFQAFVGSKVDMNKASEIREQMKHLTTLAKKYNCAVIVVCHLTKMNYSKVLDRVLGSTDITATARHVVAIGKNPDNPDDRAMVVVKSNVTSTGANYGYTITQQGLVWKEKTTLTEELMFSIPKKQKGSPKLQEAVSLLTQILQSGPQDGRDISELMLAANIAPQTIRDAREFLKINPGSGNHIWRLPETHEQDF